MDGGVEEPRQEEPKEIFDIDTDPPGRSQQAPRMPGTAESWRERLEGINTQSGKAPMRVEAKTERGQRDVRVEERGRARKVRR